MDAVKLKLPPGMYRNGTEYAGVGRYIDGDLVRWHNGVLKPINGWVPRYDLVADAEVNELWGDGAASEAVRSGIVIGDNTNGLTMYLGSNKKIYMVSASNIITDVTPAGFVAQPKSVSSNTGYGLYRYSFGQYGTPRPASSTALPNSFSWGFAEWGSWPLAVAREVGASPVFVKRLTDADFVSVAGSPQGAHDIVVTDERYAMTIGKVTDYRLVEWSDREDFEDWTPTVTNDAGSYRLAGIGKLLRGIKVSNVVLILGENDAFTAQYIGPPYIYRFDRIGRKCGIIGPNAIATYGNVAMWLGDLSFWRLDGTLEEVYCEVMDHYLNTRDEQQQSKTNAFSIIDYSELWWVYQSIDAEFNEPDSYIVYNYALDKWYTGNIDRTFGIDSDPLSYVFMISPEGKLYDHEVVSAGRDGRTPFATTGPLELENGKHLLGLSYVYPDAKTSPDVLMDLIVRDAAQAPVRHSRTFTLADPTSTHGIMGRDIRMRLYGSENSPNWSVGDFRVLPLNQRGPQR